MFKRFAASICKESTFRELVKLTLCEILLSKELILEVKAPIKEFVASEAEFSLLVVVRIFKFVLFCAASLRLRIFKIAANAGSKENVNIK